jgi:hypothetical protein
LAVPQAEPRDPPEHAAPQIIACRQRRSRTVKAGRGGAMRTRRRRDPADSLTVIRGFRLRRCVWHCAASRPKTPSSLLSIANWRSRHLRLWMILEAPDGNRVFDRPPSGGLSLAAQSIGDNWTMRTQQQLNFTQSPNRGTGKAATNPDANFRVSGSRVRQTSAATHATTAPFATWIRVVCFETRRSMGLHVRTHGTLLDLRAMQSYNAV